MSNFRHFGTVLAAVLSVLLLASGASAGDGSGNSGYAQRCQKGGYLSLVGADGTTFTTAGACTSFAAHGASFAEGLVIPAGHTATLSDAGFGYETDCPWDRLAFGYQLNRGANVQVAVGGERTCSRVPDVTVGPFPTATLLRIWLTDLRDPVYTFYSDGKHAVVSGSNPWIISIADSATGTQGPDVQRLPLGAGQGNLNVTVTIS